MLVFAAAVLGAILGSFINALSFRFGTGVSIILAHSTSLRASRSRCMQCGETLRARDLVPIFSYLFLRGCCRYCGSRVSLQYPLVEAAGALPALGGYLQNPELSAFSFQLVVWMTLLFVLVYDLRHKIIPWSASLFLLLLALVYLFFTYQLQPTTYHLAAGLLLAAPLLLVSLVSGGRWMGWGDGILELSLGSFLGITAGLSALMLAFWAGAAVGIGLMLRSKRYRMDSEVPFAPFLILGAAVAYFFNVDFFQTLPFLWP